MTTENKLTEELMQEAEQAAEPGNLGRSAVIHAMAGEFPVDMQVASLESAGYVYVYDTQTAQRSVVNRNMLDTQLRKLRPDGARFFTTVKPDFDPPRGALKCVLHPDDPNRATYDAWGFAVCPKSNLQTEFYREQHARVRHRVEWENISSAQSRKERDEERTFQRQLMNLALQTPAGGGQVIEDATNCGCGESIRPRYMTQHCRSKKHQRWESRRKNGS